MKTIEERLEAIEQKLGIEKEPCGQRFFIGVMEWKVSENLITAFTNARVPYALERSPKDALNVFVHLTLFPQPGK